MRQRSAARNRTGAASAATAAPVSDPAATFAAATAAAAGAAEPLRARRSFLGGLAIGVLAMSATGLAAAALVESPRGVAARSAAPAPSVLTAVARWHVLTDTFTVAGVVTAARTIGVTASAPFRVITVTAMPARAGDRVRPGHVIAQIDGRPILLLQGRLPAYRDLHEGDSGPDVTQLQEALERLGYADFDPAGMFGPSTALALLLLYRHLGYDPPLFHPRPDASDLPTPGAYLPMSEVTFVPGRSALVVSSAQVGAVLPRGHAVIRLAAGHPYVASAISAQAAGLMRAGMPTRISFASRGRTLAGVLTRIGQLPLPQGSGASRAPGSAGLSLATTEYPIEVAGRRPLPQRLIGATVWLTLTAPVTVRPVLSVPVAAIFASVGGRHAAHVTRIAAGGRRTNVAVFTGPMADGLVAVQSVRPGALRPGDRVLIGIAALR